MPIAMLAMTTTQITKSERVERDDTEANRARTLEE